MAKLRAHAGVGGGGADGAAVVEAPTEPLAEEDAVAGAGAEVLVAAAVGAEALLLEAVEEGAAEEADAPAGVPEVPAAEELLVGAVALAAELPAEEAAEEEPFAVVVHEPLVSAASRVGVSVKAGDGLG